MTAFPPADAEIDAAVLALTATIPSLAPPPELRAAILARVAAEESGPSPLFQFASGADFRPTPFPGVSARVLHIDRARNQFSCFLKLEPGAMYPEHAHDGPEECVVIEGSLTVGDVRMTAGDYQRTEPGSRHVEQFSETGALLFLTAPLSLLAV